MHLSPLRDILDESEGKRREMRRLCQVVLVITVMVAQALPASSEMTCLLGLSKGLRAKPVCCRHMPAACGSESNRSSAGCCVRKDFEDHPQAIAPKPLSLDHDLTSIGLPISFIADVNLRRAGGVSDWLRTPPPGPDLSKTTHLRI
jgi:hypothetical protein